MNKVLTLIAIFLLSACGSDTGKEVQTYQSLIDAAKSDPVKLSKQTEKGVTIKFNVAEFNRMEIAEKLAFVKIEHPNDMANQTAVGINFPITEKEKIGSKSEITAFCPNRNIQTGMGIVVALTDCTMK